MNELVTWQCCSWNTITVRVNIGRYESIRKSKKRGVVGGCGGRPTRGRSCPIRVAIRGLSIGDCRGTIGGGWMDVGIKNTESYTSFS